MNLLQHLYKFDAHSGKEQKFTVEVMRLCEERGASAFLDTRGNLYVIKGQSDTYPCVVAHLDEVHGPRNKNFMTEVLPDGDTIIGWQNKKTKNRHGIGADDKNGIWVALRCLENFPVLKCVFFVGEEVGCVGSRHCDMAFFDDCRFVLQCDRRNDGDLITSIGTTDLCSSEFISAIDPRRFGYHTTSGLLSDVMALKQGGLRVSCVNMSCGYYNPHTREEYTVFSHLLKCLTFVEHIIRDCTDVYPHEYRPRQYFTFVSPSQQVSTVRTGVPTPSVPTGNSAHAHSDPSDEEYEEQYSALFDFIYAALCNDPYAPIEDVKQAADREFDGINFDIFDEAFSDVIELDGADDVPF